MAISQLCNNLRRQLQLPIPPWGDGFRLARTFRCIQILAEIVKVPIQVQEHRHM